MKACRKRIPASSIATFRLLVAEDRTQRYPDDTLVAAVSGLLGSQWSHHDGGVHLVIPIAGHGAAFVACSSITAALYADPRYEKAPWGILPENREELANNIAAIMNTKSREEWVRILRENDVPCAPVTSRQEFIDWRQTIHNDMRVEIQDPELGKTIQMGIPVRLSDTPGEITGPAPRLGEETRGWRLETRSPSPKPQDERRLRSCRKEEDNNVDESARIAQGRERSYANESRIFLSYRGFDIPEYVRAPPRRIHS